MVVVQTLDGNGVPEIVQVFTCAYVKGPWAGPDAGTLNHVTVGVTRKESPKWRSRTLPEKGPVRRP